MAAQQITWLGLGVGLGFGSGFGFGFGFGLGLGLGFHPYGRAADDLGRELDAHVGALRVVDEVPRLLRQPGRVALEREQPRRRGWGLEVGLGARGEGLGAKG